MATWIDSKGETVTTKTIKEFAQRYGFREANARQLHAGFRARLRGWCSTSKRAKRFRDRFMTRLVNTITGEKAILGRSVKSFAKEHGLALHGFSQLVNGHRLMYRHWCLEKTAHLVHGDIPAPNI